MQLTPKLALRLVLTYALVGPLAGALATVAALAVEKADPAYLASLFDLSILTRAYLFGALPALATAATMLVAIPRLERLDMRFVLVSGAAGGVIAFVLAMTLRPSVENLAYGAVFALVGGFAGLVCALVFRALQAKQ